MNRLSLLPVFIFLLHFYAQAQHINDTIILTPLEVSAQGQNLRPLNNIDSLSRLSLSLTSAIELVKMNTNLFVREYAPGGISTIAFRGTSASHTVALFDGFPVNPAMSGQVDFSLLPPYLYDRMLITGNPESLLLSPEALGGIVSMFTNPNEEHPNELILRGEAGSFGNMNAGIHVHKKTGKFLFRTRGYYHTADNNYPFINNTLTERPIHRRINAGFIKKGLMQEVYYVDDRQIAFLKLTGVSNLNHLPASLLQPQVIGNEMFKQDIFRLLGGYSRVSGKHYISLKAMGSSEQWNYVNFQQGVDGTNIIRTMAGIADWQYRFTNKNTFKMQWFSEFQYVQSPNYQQENAMQTHRLTASGDLYLRKFLVRPAVHLIRKDNTDPGLSAVVVADRKILNERLLFTVSGGRSIHYPGFNDLYWFPGGNPQLLPETSWSGSAAAEWQQKNIWALRLGYTVLDVNNWIVWQPSSNSSVWSPVNVRKGISNSADLLSVIRFDVFGIHLQSVFSYSYCQSVDMGDAASPTYRSQLIYVPMHTASHSLQLTCGKFSMSIRSLYTGKRFTRADNEAYMPAHFHHDALFSYAMKFSKAKVELFAGIYNFTGENYQVIAWQPMPRRYFKVAVQVKLRK